MASILIQSFLVLLCLVLLAVISWLVFQLKRTRQDLSETQKRFQEEMDARMNGVTRTMAEQRSLQLKRLESGKISALASLGANVLHQLSQPITAVHGGAQFLKAEITPDNPLHNAVCLIEEQTTYLKKKLEELMELVRHRKIKKEKVAVQDILKDTINLFMDELRTLGIKWEVQIDDAVPPLWADAVYLQQMMIHLMLYSMQRIRMLEEQADKYLSLATYFSEEKKTVEISFQSANVTALAKGDPVMDSFFSTETKRIGVDLALCEDLINEHGGQLMVEAFSEEGLRVTVSLPTEKE